MMADEIQMDEGMKQSFGTIWLYCYQILKSRAMGNHNNVAQKMNGEVMI